LERGHGPCPPKPSRTELLRAALLEYLRAGKVLCEEAASAEELWAQLRHHEWDVLILDLCLPQHTKLQTVRTVHGRYPNLPLLVKLSQP